MKLFLAWVAAAAAVGLAPASAETQPADTAWRIESGTYEGATVTVDSRTASRRGRFWRLSADHGERLVVGWNPSRLPVAVAFRSNVPVPARDSAAFWRILRDIEEDMGMDLFTPRALEPGEDPEDVVVVEIRRMAAHAGVTLVTWSTFGSLYDARVYLRSRETLHDRRVVTHEMMHALGFGHTMGWISVMNPGPAGVERLTREDVAYAQVAISSRGPFVPLVRSRAECTSDPYSALSASCTAERSIRPLPER